ncbi:MAG: BrnT family toxin [candidate division KSB1 bacterium]|nr:BrnT family toxin [candidate division KSB1 bacterium]MDZ7301743.1 BrnT family toxin [candidate division KSB1 bacterium]MDZ7311478.1 BrnT family toxin [candidate division KSB1 bacterium]
MGLRFEWDSKKAETNIKNHGVTFVEASTVFADPLARIKDDPDHSETEERYIIIGMSQKFRILVVVFTERNDWIRIISSRLATKTERQQYEEKHHD